MAKLVAGMKVRYLPQKEWGVGHLLSLEDEGTRAKVLFPAREGGPVLVSTKQGQLVPHPLLVGDRVRLPKGQTGSIFGEVEGARGLRRYTVRQDGGEESEWPESELRALPPKPDLVTTLKEARVGDARGFLLRRKALVLDDERRCDALGALLASRVMVKPHQVGVVQRVLSARRPRFVLADEVGLGKTIEAGMIFSALRLSGLANRVLVIAPSHLTVQWLAELFHKFNQLFTLMDGDRYAASRKEQPATSPWARFDKVVTSLEQLSRSEEHLSEASRPTAFWDLVIIDEAHHLKAEKAFEAARALAGNSWGLLLLTATPMQLDPEEYHSLLTLIEPSTAPTLEDFRRRQERQEELSTAVRTLLAAKDARAAKPAVSSLASRFPKDRKLRRLKGEELLSHLSETYSLSDRLVRNRRAVVGGFAERRLHRHLVELPDSELRARAEAVAALREGRSLSGAALSNLLRRLESSPAAFLEAVRGTRALVGKELRLPGRDAKFLAFAELLRGIWRAEPKAKVLAFTESRETLESLKEKLREENVHALAYHGELPLLDRDRQVARFRDPEGPKVLLCTEIGGEGRNFQFAHHLVNYDLPWSPAMMEQRVGRLDRIGQTRPVDIHVFEVPGMLSADVLSVLADAAGVFGETVGGLDAVLEEVEPRLTELALSPPPERAAYVASLKEKVQAAREAVRRAYDPLLDLRSFDREAVEALVKKALGRFGLAGEGGELEGIEDGLWAIARDLDERLEETVAELARKVGIGVDTEEHVEAFQVAFHFGHALNVEALPGLSLTEEKVVLGTFWRDTAVELEEIDYFATGHPLVEALFGFLRDGPYGRNGVRYLERRGGRARGLELIFHITPPEPADTSAGAKVPSRQLSRFLDRLLIHLAVAEAPGGVPRVDDGLLPALDAEGQPLMGEQALAAFPSLAAFVEPAVAAGTQAAEAEMRKRAVAARAAVEAERDSALERMRLSLSHQGVPAEAAEAQLAEERAHYQRLLEALAGLKVELDSACAFAINR